MERNKNTTITTKKRIFSSERERGRERGKKAMMWMCREAHCGDPIDTHTYAVKQD